MSARKPDGNGWVEIKGNPISKVGVFEYSGGQIDHDGSLGLDPNQIYNMSIDQRKSYQIPNVSNLSN